MPARRHSLLLAGMAFACAVGVALSYLLFVWTRHGQAFEYDVLKGAPAPLDTPSVLHARAWLAYVTEYSVGAVLVLVLAIGLLRRRPALAVVGAATIGVTAVLDRVLVNWVLTRPPIVYDAFSPGNSFPSGHVAMSTAALLGLLIVVPHAWRGAVALSGSVLILGIAGMTMTVGWHRLSDTIGGNLLALGVGCLGLAVLILRAGAHTPRPRWRLPSGLLAIVPLLGYVVWTAANGAGPAYDVLVHDSATPAADYQAAMFHSAAGIATVISTMTVVVFLAVNARIEPAPIKRQRD
jgi:membrane-associated phospholipid phosphatase